VGLYGFLEPVGDSGSGGFVGAVGWVYVDGGVVPGFGESVVVG